MDITDFHNNNFIIVNDDFVYTRANVSAEKNEATVESVARTRHHLQELRHRLDEVGSNGDVFVILYQAVLTNDIVRQGMNLVPSAEGVRRIINLYRDIEPCCSIIMKMSETGPFASEDDSLLYWAAYGTIKMYEEYCVSVRGLIDLPTLQSSGVSSPTDNIEPTTTSSTIAIKSATDPSNSRSFTPITEYNMSALYQFLVDERVVVGVDEKQFADCINQANIEPLWETTGTKNFFKLFLHTLKEYYKETYMQRGRVNPEWFLVCCDSIDVTAEYMGKMNIPNDKRVKFCENMKLYIKP